VLLSYRNLTAGLQEAWHSIKSILILGQFQNISLIVNIESEIVLIFNFHKGSSFLKKFYVNLTKKAK